MQRVHLASERSSYRRSFLLATLLLTLPLLVLFHCVATGLDRSRDHDGDLYGMCRVEDDFDLGAYLFGKRSGGVDCISSELGPADGGFQIAKSEPAKGRGAALGTGRGARGARRAPAAPAGRDGAIAFVPKTGSDAQPSVDAGPNWGGSQKDVELWPIPKDAPRLSSQAFGGRHGAAWLLFALDGDGSGGPPGDDDPPGGALPVPEPSARLLFLAGFLLIARTLLHSARRSRTARGTIPSAGESA